MRKASFVIALTVLCVSSSTYAQTVASTKTGSSTSSNNSRQPKPQRVIDSSEWDILWVRGFEKEEDLLYSPRSISFHNNEVYVTDQGTREILVLDAATGATVRKIVANNGRGPGEIRRPSFVAVGFNTLAVADLGNGRITALDNSLKLLWDYPINFTTGICMHSPTLMAILSPDYSFMEVRDTTGAVKSTRRFPWTGDSTNVLTSGVHISGPTRKGECVLARAYGNQFAVVPLSGAIRTYSYIEHMPEPVVNVTSQTLEKTRKSEVTRNFYSTDSKQSATAVVVAGDTVIVKFAGETAHKMRVLDYYLATNGTYLFSRLLRYPTISIGASPDGTIYAAEIAESIAGIVAFRPKQSKVR